MDEILKLKCDRSLKSSRVGLSCDSVCLSIVGKMNLESVSVLVFSVDSYGIVRFLKPFGTNMNLF